MSTGPRESVLEPARLLALIFDLDGVIIDTEPLHLRAKQLAFERHGVHVPPGFFDEFTGRSDRDVAEQAVRRHGDGSAAAERNSAEHVSAERSSAEHVLVEQVVAAKHAIFAELRGEIEPVPGALGFLRRARQRFTKLALTTSATRDNQTFAFARFDLAPFFDVVVTAEDIQRTKPDPEPYRVTVERLGLAAAECLVIEDSLNGILSAKAAGCAVAGITTSFGASELARAAPEWIVGDFAELASRLAL